MIQYNPKTWFSLIFHSYSRFVVKTMLPALLFMGLFTASVCVIMLEVFGFNSSHFQSTTALHSLLGIVLGLFLVFRTNSAYDRWWEGRKLWGAMVNGCGCQHLQRVLLGREQPCFIRCGLIPRFVKQFHQAGRIGHLLVEGEFRVMSGA